KLYPKILAIQDYPQTLPKPWKIHQASPNFFFCLFDSTCAKLLANIELIGHNAAWLKATSHKKTKLCKRGSPTKRMVRIHAARPIGRPRGPIEERRAPKAVAAR